MHEHVKLFNGISKKVYVYIHSYIIWERTGSKESFWPFPRLFVQYIHESVARIERPCRCVEWIETLLNENTKFYLKYIQSSFKLIFIEQLKTHAHSSVFTLLFTNTHTHTQRACSVSVYISAHRHTHTHEHVNTRTYADRSAYTLNNTHTLITSHHIKLLLNRNHR